MKGPKVRFKQDDEICYPPILFMQLSEYLEINTDRNKAHKYDKSDVLSVSGEYGVVNQIEFQGRSYAGVDVGDYHVLYTGDVVYTKSPLKENPYGIVKFNKGPTGIVSTLYAVYHCKNNVDGRFIEYYFDLKSRLNNYLKPLVNIGAKHDMKISAEKAISGLVAFPCLEEQKKVADFLSFIDEVITITETEVQNLEMQKKATMKKIFSQEVRFKREDGTDFPEWDETRFEDIVSLVTDSIDPKKAGAMHCVELEHLEQRSGQRIGYAIAEKLDSNKRLFKEGDVLFGKLRPYLRKYWIATEAGCCSSEIWVLRPKMGILSRYLLGIVSSDAFISTANTTEGTKMPRANWDVVSGEIVLIPCLDEQKLITEFLSNFDEAIAATKKELELWKELKKGLLQQMFV